MDKLQTIQRSLRCYWFSLAGLIPVLGLPFAVHACFRSRRLRKETRGQWNPAHSYLTWASRFGWLGILVFVVAVGYIVALIMNAMSTSSNY